MDREAKRILGFFLMLLMLTSLACALGDVNLPEVDVPSGAAATAEGAARMAATAMAEVTIPAGAVETAEAAAQQAGGLAATAVALAGQEGGDIVATLEASDFNLDIVVNSEPLRDKIRNARPDANGNVRITFTQEELNQAITLREQAPGEQSLDLDEPTLLLSEGQVVLTAQMRQPLQGELRATFEPTVEAEQVRFNLTAARIGEIPLPTAVLSTAEAAINASLANLVAGMPSNYTITEILVGEGTLTVVAQPDSG